MSASARAERPDAPARGPLLSIIVAMDRQGVIGRDQSLPWHLPDELAYFKRTTMGRPILMGRRTFESIGRVLPGRRNVVITRTPGWRAEGCEAFASLDAALAALAAEDEVFVIGGAMLYAAALPRCRRLYVTHVEVCVDGDVRFPHFDPERWREIRSEGHAPDGRHAHAFRLAVYEPR